MIYLKNIKINIFIKYFLEMNIMDYGLLVIFFFKNIKSLLIKIKKLLVFI